MAISVSKSLPPFIVVLDPVKNCRVNSKEDKDLGPSLLNAARNGTCGDVIEQLRVLCSSCKSLRISCTRGTHREYTSSTGTDYCGTVVICVGIDVCTDEPIDRLRALYTPNLLGDEKNVEYFQTVNELFARLSALIAQAAVEWGK